MKHVRRWVGLIGLAWVAGALAQEMPRADADAFIERLASERAAKGAVTVDFREQRTVSALTRPATAEGTLTFQPPDKFRREIRGPRGSVAVSDGKTFWIYYPEFQEVERYDLESQRFLHDAITAITAGMDADTLRKEFRWTVRRDGDRHLLELVPRRGSVRKAVQSVLLRIRPDFTAESSEIVFPNGDRTVTVFTNERQVRPAASDFTFTPPSGTRVSTPLGR